MKVIARIKGENQSLLDDLQTCNINARLVKNAIVVDLPKLGDTDYAIPDIILKEKNIAYFIECSEYGGSNGDTGKAVLVCDKAGNPMRPYYIPKLSSSDNGAHAYFAVPLCVSVTAIKETNILYIEEHALSISHESSTSIITLKTRKLWEGVYNNMPEALERFKRVVETAVLKSNTAQCKIAYYIQDKKER